MTQEKKTLLVADHNMENPIGDSLLTESLLINVGIDFRWQAIDWLWFDWFLD